jgi:hypothetical protein
MVDARRATGGHDSRERQTRRSVTPRSMAMAFTLATVSGRSAPASVAAPSSLERWLVAVIALAAWSIVPPYLGPLVGLELDVSATVEIVDHVVPGLLAAAAAYIALVDVRRGRADSARMFAALGVCVLAGLFQTVSHATLVLDAGGPLQPVGAVVLHASPGPLLLVVSLWLLLRPGPAEASP